MVAIRQGQIESGIICKNPKIVKFCLFLLANQILVHLLFNAWYNFYDSNTVKLMFCVHVNNEFYRSTPV